MESYPWFANAGGVVVAAEAAEAAEVDVVVVVVVVVVVDGDQPRSLEVRSRRSAWHSSLE